MTHEELATNVLSQERFEVFFKERVEDVMVSSSGCLLLVRLPAALGFGQMEDERRLGDALGVVEQLVRKGDLLGRHGRSSICVFLGGATVDNAQLVAARLRVWLKDYQATVGLASFPEHGQALPELIGAARAAAY